MVFILFSCVVQEAVKQGRLVLSTVNDSDLSSALDLLKLLNNVSMDLEIAVRSKDIKLLDETILKANKQGRYRHPPYLVS
jgi:hypothetical protein